MSHTVCDFLLGELNVPLLGFHILHRGYRRSHRSYNLLLGDVILLVKFLKLCLGQIDIQNLRVVADSCSHGHVGLLGESFLADHEIHLLARILFLLWPALPEKVLLVLGIAAFLNSKVHFGELLDLIIIAAKDPRDMRDGGLRPLVNEDILAAVIEVQVFHDGPDIDLVLVVEVVLPLLVRQSELDNVFLVVHDEEGAVGGQSEGIGVALLLLKLIEHSWCYNDSIPHKD